MCLRVCFCPVPVALHLLDRLLQNRRRRRRCVMRVVRVQVARLLMRVSVPQRVRVHPTS